MFFCILILKIDLQNQEVTNPRRKNIPTINKHKTIKILCEKVKPPYSFTLNPIYRLSTCPLIIDLYNKDNIICICRVGKKIRAKIFFISFFSTWKLPALH